MIDRPWLQNSPEASRSWLFDEVVQSEASLGGVDLPNGNPPQGSAVAGFHTDPLSCHEEGEKGRFA
jgi:hypothetical protein